MLRRATGIGILLLAATGCANWRGQMGELSPGDLASPVARVTPAPQSSSYPEIAGSASAASPIPTTLPSGSTPPILPAQATLPHTNWPTTPPDLIVPPPVVPLPTITTGPMLPNEPTKPPPPDPPGVEPVVRALNYLLDKRHTESSYELQAYPPLTRDAFQEILAITAFTARKGVEDWNADDMAVVQMQLDRLAEMIRPRAALSISRLCFCDTITGYTMYRPLPADHAFLAAHGDRPGELVQLYMEMKNLGSRPDGGQFVTDLACAIEIVDLEGRVRWSHRFRPEDLRLARRSPLLEYYHNFSFYLPASLSPGDYRLNVRLSDRTHPESPRDATSSAPLHIVGDR